MGRPIAPNSACVVTTAQTIASASKGSAVWFAIRAGGATQGSMILYDDDSASGTVADLIATITAPASNMSPMYGPYFVSCGLIVTGITGGSAIIWVRKPA